MKKKFVFASVQIRFGFGFILAASEPETNGVRSDQRINIRCRNSCKPSL